MLPRIDFNNFAIVVMRSGGSARYSDDPVRILINDPDSQ